MTLCIQDPTDPNSEYLIDTLLEASNGATRGGGAFAFLSRGGVQLFLRDPGFAAFASAGAFDLVVGVDAITVPIADARHFVAAERAPSGQPWRTGSRRSSP